MQSSNALDKPTSTSPKLYSGTIKELITSSPTPLASIRKEQGDGFVSKVIERTIDGLIVSLNVSKNMSESQIAEAAQMIYSEYYYWSVQHIVMAFNNFKMGKYPEIELFHSFDITTIFKILHRFENDLKKAKEQVESEAIQEKYKKWEQSYLENKPSDEIIEQVKAITTKIMDKKEYKKAPEPKEWSRTRELLAEFDELWRNEPSSGAVRVISVEGRKLTQSEYLVYRVNKENGES